MFEDYADLHARIDDPDLDVDETWVLVLKRMGRKGAPGCRSGRRADPAQAPAEGREGHGAHLGRGEVRSPPDRRSRTPLTCAGPRYSVEPLP
jgi:hypothetical protein